MIPWQCCQCQARGSFSRRSLGVLSPQAHGFFQLDLGENVLRGLWLATKFHLLLASAAPMKPHICSRLRQRDREITSLNLNLNLGLANRAARHRYTVSTKVLGQQNRGTRETSLSLLANRVLSRLLRSSRGSFLYLLLRCCID